MEENFIEVAGDWDPSSLALIEALYGGKVIFRKDPTPEELAQLKELISNLGVKDFVEKYKTLDPVFNIEYFLDGNDYWDDITTMCQEILDTHKEFLDNHPFVSQHRDYLSDDPYGKIIWVSDMKDCEFILNEFWAKEKEINNKWWDVISNYSLERFWTGVTKNLNRSANNDLSQRTLKALLKAFN